MQKTQKKKTRIQKKQKRAHVQTVAAHKIQASNKNIHDITTNHQPPISTDNKKKKTHTHANRHA